MAATAGGKAGRILGKRVGGFLYVHRTALGLLGKVERAAVDEAARIVGEVSWNVVKVGNSLVSLLRYEDFDAAPFPALLESWKVDLQNGTATRTDYAWRDSPPILHRKETMLRPDDPRIPRFAALTRKAEENGLFNDTKIIGTR